MEATLEYRVLLGEWNFSLKGGEYLQLKAGDC